MIGGAVKHDAPVAHADHAVTVAAGGVQRVQVGDDHAAIFVMDATQCVHHDLGIHRVKAGDGFIGQNDLRVLHQGAGNRDALLLATRQRLGPFGGLFGDAKAVKDRQGAGDISLGPEVEHGGKGGAAVQHAVHHVRRHIHPGHEVELLEDHRALALPGAHLGPFQGQNVAAFKFQRARGGIGQTVHHAQECRFARTRAANDADEGRFFDLERGVVHGGLLAEHAGDILDGQQWGNLRPDGGGVVRSRDGNLSAL